MTKVVVNRCFGGFSISLAAARFMAARGNDAATAELAEYDAKIADPSKMDELEHKYGPRWFGYGYAGRDCGYDRDDPDLVAAVEALGDEANGSHARLQIVEIPDDVAWTVEEYDGNEHIAEEHRTW